MGNCRYRKDLQIVVKLSCGALLSSVKLGLGDLALLGGSGRAGAPELVPGDPGGARWVWRDVLFTVHWESAARV